MTIRVIIPSHLRALTKIEEEEVLLDIKGDVTQRAVLDALEAKYPALLGTIRDHETKKRRAFLRFFACGEDITHEPADAPLPEAVVKGDEPFLVIAAIAGG
jgi:sulfur-carrier protein